MTGEERVLAEVSTWSAL